MAQSNEPRYRWHGWAEEVDNDNEDDRKDVWYLTIADNEEELAVIVHRTCRGDDGVEKYPIDGALATAKTERADRIVAALNAQDALDNLAPNAKYVLGDVLSEININAVASDVHAAEDIASDIVSRLYRTYRVIPYDDGEPGPLNKENEPRNLARFSTDDAKALLGRPLTKGEERNLVKTLENSSMGEVFAECLDLITEED